jgi:hypothetical protein
MRVVVRVGQFVLLERHGDDWQIVKENNSVDLAENATCLLIGDRKAPIAPRYDQRRVQPSTGRVAPM